MAGSAWASKPRTLRDGTQVQSVYYRRGGRGSRPTVYGTYDVVQTETVLREVRALLTLGVDPAEAKRRASGLPAAAPPAAPQSTDQRPATGYTFGAWLNEFKPMYARYRRAGDKHKTTVPLGTASGDNRSRLLRGPVADYAARLGTAKRGRDPRETRARLESAHPRRPQLSLSGIGRAECCASSE
jgi:hypothetical protein